MNTNADYIAWVHGLRIQGTQRFVANNRTAKGLGRCSRQHIQPPRRDDRGTKRAVARIDQVNSHTFLVSLHIRAQFLLNQRGTDAPICQDTRSGSQVCGLARSVVCHHALKDLAGENAFETADDLPFGPPFSGASFDVVEGW